MDKLLDTPEVARRMGVAVTTVARWCRDGRFSHAFRVGRSWAIPAGDLEGFTPPVPGRPPKEKEPKD